MLGSVMRIIGDAKQNEIRGFGNNNHNRQVNLVVISILYLPHFACQFDLFTLYFWYEREENKE